MQYTYWQVPLRKVHLFPFYFQKAISSKSINKLISTIHLANPTNAIIAYIFKCMPQIFLHSNTKTALFFQVSRMHSIIKYFQFKNETFSKCFS